MTTLADLIQETRMHLLTMQRDELNLLAAGFTTPAPPATQVLTFTYPLGGIRQGAYLSIDLEVLYVLQVTGSTVTAIGGQLGSTPATHATGAIAYVNPKFTDFAIGRAINQEIVSLSAPDNGMFAVKEVDFTYNPAVMGYDLTDVNTGLAATDVIELLDVRYETSGPSRDNPAVHSWRLDRLQDEAAFPSGYRLTLYESAYPGLNVHVHYKTNFTALPSLTSDAVTVGGLPSTALDIPPIGAGIRLMAGREIKRNFTEAQDEPKRAQEVPPGAVAGSVKNLMMLWQRRVQEEASRQQAAWMPVGNRA